MTDGFEGRPASDHDYADWVKRHAPDDWATRYGVDPPDVNKLFTDRFGGDSGNTFTTVVSVDIRLSTQLMNLANDMRFYALALNDFVGRSAGTLRHAGAWFDKFTGDGFLAYWIHTPASRAASEEGRLVLPDRPEPILAICSGLHTVFRESILPLLERQVRAMPADAGLAIGLDVGGGQLVSVYNDLTVIGPTIVQAVRMCSAADAGETVITPAFFSALAPGTVPPEFGAITKERRSTKEFPLSEDGTRGGQWVYVHRTLDPRR